MLNTPMIQAAIQRVAEQRILEAMEKGLFDHLPGEGKPLKNLDVEPAGAELVGWVREWMKREGLRVRV